MNTMKNYRKKTEVLFGFYLITTLFGEFLLAVLTNQSITLQKFIFIWLFSVVISLLLYALSIVFTRRLNTIISFLIVILMTILYISQFMYFKIFKLFYPIYSVLHSKQIVEFSDFIIDALLSYWPVLIVFLLPLIVFTFIHNKMIDFSHQGFKYGSIIVVLALLFHGITLGAIQLQSKESEGIYDLYYEHHKPQVSMDKLGVMTTLRLDAYRLLTNWEEDVVIVEPDPIEPEPIEPDPIDPIIPEPPTPIEYNIIHYDFEKLKEFSNTSVNQLHDYFSQITPTNKNEMTGKYKGYNLILITAEAFHTGVIDKELTPTLYKMATEGIQFTNFYTPVWEVSTSDGEYVATSGLLPKSGVWSYTEISNNQMPFALGNQLNKLDYTSLAFHNHTYTYYNRHLSYPTMGYTYEGVGNGLVMENIWPRSDLQLMEITTDKFVEMKPFHVYYLSVSGHMKYSYDDNMIAYRNREVVEDLPYSDAVKAYLAANYEFEKAMTYLLDTLKEKGVLDNTLIAISADHYPYGLTNEEISELLGHSVEENFELYKNTFILYNSTMEPMVVDKPMASVDILPTLSNLLGLEYDSRLMAGKDIFSDSEPLVIFLNRSFITKDIMYNAKTKEVIQLSDRVLSDEQLQQLKDKVDSAFYYSKRIIELDYYKFLESPE